MFSDLLSLKTMLKTYYFLFLSTFLLSCEENKPNDFILSEEQLVPILADFHLIDAAAKQGVLQNNRNNFIRHKQYKSILHHHKVEEERFDSTLNYFSNHLDQFSEIYQKVEQKLVEDLSKYQESEE